MSRTLARQDWTETRKREEPRYWSEVDPRALYYAVIEACRIYQYRDLRDNLRNFSWRHADAYWPTAL